MEQYLTAEFNLYAFIGIMMIYFFIMVRSNYLEEQKQKNHTRSLKIGSRVLIVGGYFHGQDGEIVEYVPFKKLAPYTYQNEGFKVQTAKQTAFFQPHELILKQEKK